MTNNIGYKHFQLESWGVFLEAHGYKEEPCIFYAATVAGHVNQ